MIKIHKKLWYVVAPDREENLAYMTHWEDNEAFYRRESTGMSWATPRGSGGKVIPRGVIIDNTPVKEIYIGCSVSRWTTSNKLFRVSDPRGFTVEVATDNIATLLHLTTVINGVIQEECVWARDGNNHVLLPVNSEPYLETLDKMDQIANRLIPLKDIKVGDWFKLFENDSEYYYAGKVKCTWKVSPWAYEDYWQQRGGRRGKIYAETREVVEKGYRDLFLRKWSDNDISETSMSKTAKITEVLRNEIIPIPKRGISCPRKYYQDHYYADTELLSLEFKV